MFEKRSTLRRAAIDAMKLMEDEINKEKNSVNLADLLTKFFQKKTNLAKYDGEILNVCKEETTEKN